MRESENAEKSARSRCNACTLILWLEGYFVK